MELKEIVYEKRPLKVELDDTTKTLSKILDIIAVENEMHWSFSGGFARDLWLRKPWNDYDLCLHDTGIAQRRMRDMGILAVNQRMGDEIPHDYYVDPYAFNKSQYPIHWIQADDQWAYAPKHFDFSINQICLKPDGYFHAPTFTWRDLDRRIIRQTSDRMTTNIVMRAIRFASKYDFVIHDDLIRDIKEKVENRDSLDTLSLMRNAEKMKEDDVEAKSLELMQELGVPGAAVAITIDDFISYHNRMVVTGRAHREPGNHRYGR